MNRKYTLVNRYKFAIFLLIFCVAISAGIYLVQNTVRGQKLEASMTITIPVVETKREIMANTYALMLEQNEQDNIYTLEIARLEGELAREQSRLKVFQGRLFEADTKIAGMQTALASLSAPTKATMVITAYTEREEECARPATSEYFGMTASGEYVVPWRTAASNDYPLGTIVYIPRFKDAPNRGIFIITDRMNARYSNSIDIYTTSLDQARIFGRHETDVFILHRTDTQPGTYNIDFYKSFTKGWEELYDFAWD